MTCRNTKIGSAVTSFVKILDGLEEYQSLSLLHEVAREAPTNAPAPGRTEIVEFVDQMRAKVDTSSAFTEARKRSLHARLDLAATAGVEADTFFAVKRIEERAEVAKVALDEYYLATARELGESVANIRARLRASYEESKRERTLSAPAEWANEFTSRPSHAGLPMDRHTAYAMWRIDNELAERQGEVEARPTVTNHQRVRGAGVAGVGYDRETGRLEVEFRNRPGHWYGYQNVPESIASELVSSDNANPTAFFNRMVRTNSDFSYADQAEADAAGVTQRCRTCGQYAASGHGCPARGSAEEMAFTTERARIQQRVVRARTQVATGTPEERIERYARLSGNAVEAAERVAAEDQLADMSPDTAMRHRQNQRLEATMQPYRGESGTFRATALSTVRRIADEEGRALVPVVARISRVADEDGPARTVEMGVVTGRVQVVSEGGGFTASPVTTPGDSGQDQLKCTCLDYRTTYDCVHVRQVVADFNQRINAEFLRTPHSFNEAVAAANAEAHTTFVAAAAGRVRSREAWEAGGDGVTYAGEEGAAVFQADYAAAKARREAGENPIPYMTENATDGLGAPGTGRGFGIELEFKMDPNIDYTQRATKMRAILRELNDLGLTRHANQDRYHAASSRGYSSSHQGGWTAEQDGSVDMEIVSPIMNDTPETWENIAKVCEIIRRNGGVVDKDVGCHVNVSTADYGTDVGNANRLLSMTAANEDTVYRMASNPGAGGHRAAFGSSYAVPNPVPGRGFTSVRDAGQANRRPHAINLGHSVTGGANDRVEFRVFDGSLQETVIQSQIKFALAATEAAWRDTDATYTGHQPLGSTRTAHRAEHGARRRLTGEEWRASTESVRELTDQLFRRHEDKQQMAALFAETTWSNPMSSRRGW